MTALSLAPRQLLPVGGPHPLQTLPHRLGDATRLLPCPIGKVRLKSHMDGLHGAAGRRAFRPARAPGFLCAVHENSIAHFLWPVAFLRTKVGNSLAVLFRMAYNNGIR